MWKKLNVSLIRLQMHLQKLHFVFPIRCKNVSNSYNEISTTDFSFLSISSFYGTLSNYFKSNLSLWKCFSSYNESLLTFLKVKCRFFIKSRRKEDLDRTDGFSMCHSIVIPYHDRHFRDRLENFQPRPAKKCEVPLISFCFLFSSTL